MVPMVPRTFADVGMEVWGGIFEGISLLCRWVDFDQVATIEILHTLWRGVFRWGNDITMFSSPRTGQPQSRVGSESKKARLR